MANTYQFREIHPSVSIGCASDRYNGWIGQIYTQERYSGRIETRKKKLGKEIYTEKVLPVDSVAEYFEHFDILEIDFTFYGLLYDKEFRPTRVHKTLEAYANHLPSSGAGIFLKVPQSITAQKVWRAGKFNKNPNYLDTALFHDRFYSPAQDLLSGRLAGLIFEQEYHRKSERQSAENVAQDLDRFFSQIASIEGRGHHVELRTPSYLSPPVFEVLKRHGIGQVLSYWTWLPGLNEQFAKAGGQFLTSERQVVIRLLTPRRMRYGQTYAKAYPFDKMVEGMLQPEMIAETVDLMQEATRSNVHANIIVNNRAGGNAPMIAERLVQGFRQTGAS